GGGVDFAIGGDDAAKGRDRIGAQSLQIGGLQVAGHGDAAGIGMLDDGDGGRFGGVEFADQFEGGIGIVDIVVGERLALHLVGGGDARAILAVLVEGGPLM